MDLRDASPEELQAFFDEHGAALIEEEAIRLLQNRFCTTKMATAIASDERLAGYYEVRKALVRHRATPQGHAMKFVPHLYWADLLRLSIDTTIHAAIRRAIDQHLLMRLPKVTLGEKIAAARGCSREIMRALLTDPNPRVFEALLINPRLTEDDLVTHVSAGRATAQQLAAVASSPKWSFRMPLRRALVLNPDTPKAVAAAQLRFLPKADLDSLLRSSTTSTYIRRCIERLTS